MKHKLKNFFRQFALMLLVIWTVVSLVTLLIELVPGDPATKEVLREPGDPMPPSRIFAMRFGSALPDIDMPTRCGSRRPRSARATWSSCCE